jgi:hypothetical protein
VHVVGPILQVLSSQVVSTLMEISKNPRLFWRVQARALEALSKVLELAGEKTREVQTRMVVEFFVEEFKSKCVDHALQVTSLGQPRAFHSRPLAAFWHPMNRHPPHARRAAARSPA